MRDHFQLLDIYADLHFIDMASNLQFCHRIGLVAPEVDDQELMVTDVLTDTVDNRQNPYASWQERYLMIDFINLTWGTNFLQYRCESEEEYCTWGVDDVSMISDSELGWAPFTTQRNGIKSYTLWDALLDSSNLPFWSILFGWVILINIVCLVLRLHDELAPCCFGKRISEQQREVLKVLCWMILHDGLFLQNDGFHDVNSINIHLFLQLQHSTSLEQATNNGGNILEKSETGRASSSGDLGV